MPASMFIAGGIDTLATPSRAAAAGGDVATDVAEAAPVDLPGDPEQLVMIDAGVKIVAACLLASGGRLARVGAIACAASLIPTTWAAHRFWEIDDPAGAGDAAGPVHEEPEHARRSADRRRRHRRPAVDPVGRAGDAAHELKDKASDLLPGG